MEERLRNWNSLCEGTAVSGTGRVSIFFAFVRSAWRLTSSIEVNDNHFLYNSYWLWRKCSATKNLKNLMTDKGGINSHSLLCRQFSEHFENLVKPPSTKPKLASPKLQPDKENKGTSLLIFPNAYNVSAMFYLSLVMAILSKAPHPYNYNQIALTSP